MEQRCSFNLFAKNQLTHRLSFQVHFFKVIMTKSDAIRVGEWFNLQLVHQFHWIQADLQTCCEDERWALSCYVISQSSYKSKYDRLPLPHWQYDQPITAPLYTTFVLYTQFLFIYHHLFSLYNFLKSSFVYVGACLFKEYSIALESDAFIQFHCFCSKQPSNGFERRSACVC